MTVIIGYLSVLVPHMLLSDLLVDVTSGSLANMVFGVE